MTMNDKKDRQQDDSDIFDTKQYNQNDLKKAAADRKDNAADSETRTWIGRGDRQSEGRGPAAEDRGNPQLTGLADGNSQQADFAAGASHASNFAAGESQPGGLTADNSQPAGGADPASSGSAGGLPPRSSRAAKPGFPGQPDKPAAPKKRWWLYPTLAVLLAVVIIGIYYVYSILSFADKIQNDPEDSRFKDVQDEEVAGPPVWEGTDRVNILLLGADARGFAKNEIPRSDTMMIASIDPVTKKATLFSILRDTYGDIPGRGKDRINAAIVHGGPNLAMQTVSELTGLEIQYYLYTEFQGFISLIDTLGGIEFEVEKRMVWKDSHDDPMYHIDLQPGLQTLDGQSALAYVRFRHDALSDYTRTQRQRALLSALADKLKSTTSLLKLPAILKSVENYVETNIAFEDMLKLGSLGLTIDTKNIASIQLPPSEFIVEMKVNGAEVLGLRSGADLPAYVREQLDKQAAEAAEAAEAAQDEEADQQQEDSSGRQ